MRVFIGPEEISGIAAELAQGLQDLDQDAHLVLSVKHPFAYGKMAVPFLLRVWQFLGAARYATPRHKLLRKIIFVGIHEAWAWLVLVYSFFRFDAFLFLYGRTITNTRFELSLLRYFNKRMIFIYAGSDSRPPYLDGVLSLSNFPENLSDPAKLMSVTKRSKLKIGLHELYADYLVASPASAHFFELPYINWFSMGIPKTMPVSINQTEEGSGKVRILHGPSNPLVKGTDFIVTAIDRLREKGYQIELIMIHGVPNEKVLQELARCDFVIDQLYSDTPLAAFATEAAFFGKPAVVGGYFAKQLGDYLAPDDIPPSLFVMPDDLESAIERLISDSVLRRNLGNMAQQFVAERWNTRIVAERYLRLLNRDVPAAWWANPSDVRYTEGWGQPRERSKLLISSLLRHFGSSALQVSDKPELESAFVAMASECSKNTHHA